MRRQARADAQRDRKLGAWSGPSQIWNSDFANWIELLRSAPRGYTSKQQWSTNDELADRLVSAGDGIAEVIEATGLPTRLHVYESIDRQIVVRALRNDLRRQPVDPLPTDGLGG